MTLETLETFATPVIPAMSAILVILATQETTREMTLEMIPAPIPETAPVVWERRTERIRGTVEPTLSVSVPNANVNAKEWSAHRTATASADPWPRLAGWVTHLRGQCCPLRRL